MKKKHILVSLQVHTVGKFSKSLDLRASRAVAWFIESQYIRAAKQKKWRTIGNANYDIIMYHFLISFLVSAFGRERTTRKRKLPIIGASNGHTLILTTVMSISVQIFFRSFVFVRRGY